MRRRRGSLAGNPLLIGALTALIIVVAVYIAYNAAAGLPFTPTYKIDVELPTASDLFPGNEVRIKGTRVGVVEKLEPHQDPRTGRLTAIAMLKLEKNAGPLPVDTKAIVQSVSSVGLKYLRLEKGTSRKTIPEGGKIPLSQTREPVDINEFFDMFNKPTRKANKQGLISFGTGLAGRGAGLNGALKTLRPLVDRLAPVMRHLASPETGFGRMWDALDRAAKEAAPVAGAQGRFYKDLNVFFAAWAKVAPSLERAIEGGPSSLRQANYSLPHEAAFVRKATKFMALLRPSAKALRTAAPPLGHAFKVGAINFKRAQSFNSELASATQAVESFAKNQTNLQALEDLTNTSRLAGPLFAGLAPEQATCNYLTLTFRNAASLFSESIGVGTIARVEAVLAPAGPNDEGYPAATPANGPSVQKTVEGTLVDNNHVHYNPYPNVGGPGQPSLCEAGNETYEVGKAVIGHAKEVGTGREGTKRSESLYGREYEQATLKDLGLAGGKSESSGKAKSGDKAKGGSDVKHHSAGHAKASATRTGAGKTGGKGAKK